MQTGERQYSCSFMSLSAVGLKGEIDFSENEAPVTEGAGLFSPVTIKTLQPFCSQTICPIQKFDKNIS